MVWSYILMSLLLITSVLLMIIILLQRGRGGGLAGAFGGLGGQSAFGTKAGDVFTKITIGLAVFWILLAGVSSLALERDSQRRFKEELPPQGNVGTAEELPIEEAPPEKPANPFADEDTKKKAADEPAGAAADAKTKDEKKEPEKPAEPKDQPPADAKSSAPEKQDGDKTGEQTEKQ